MLPVLVNGLRTHDGEYHGVLDLCLHRHGGVLRPTGDHPAVVAAPRSITKHAVRHRGILPVMSLKRHTADVDDAVGGRSQANSPSPSPCPP